MSGKSFEIHFDKFLWVKGPQVLSRSAERRREIVVICNNLLPITFEIDSSGAFRKESWSQISVSVLFLNAKVVH